MNIVGPEGVLEAEFTLPAQTGKAITQTGQNIPGAAVLCHPHPQYGGSMHDLVLASVEAALLAAGIASLRFNFRGVGASAGRYSGGGGELADLQAVVRWLRDTHQPARLYLAGYSFGAAVVWQSLPSLQPDQVVLVAPPVAVMPFESFAPAMRVDVFAGDRDDYVSEALLKTLTGAHVHMLPGADHFFSGYTDQLQQQISSLLASGTDH